MLRQSCAAIGLTAVAAAALAAAPATAMDIYVRGSVGHEWSRDTTFRDRDCTATDPPALFGCGPGIDGRPLGGRGDFGSSPAVEFGLGARVLPFLRLEAAVGHRFGLGFSGEANFLATPGRQPVKGAVDQTTAMAFAHVDVAQLMKLDVGRFEPFVGAGLGVARNRIGRMTYSFPGLAQPAFSRTPGGSRYDLAWAATAGVGYRLTDRAMFEVAYRYSDYGQVETDSGPMINRRGGPEFTIDIAPTRARLRSHAVMSGIRFSF